MGAVKETARIKLNGKDLGALSGRLGQGHAVYGHLSGRSATAWGGGRKAGPGGNLVGWMLLSHKKQATASSVLEKHPIEHAFDENIRTWWSAKTGDKGEWLAVDLGKPCRINAVQVNFAEQDVTAQAKRRPEDELYHQYVMETSDAHRAPLQCRS